jgi:hypothetical protein
MQQSMCPTPNEIRAARSDFFNTLQPGLVVHLERSFAARHHDVISSRPELEGVAAVIVEKPVYPATWLSVRVQGEGVVKVRTSQLSERQVTGGRSMPVSTIGPPPQAASSVAAAVLNVQDVARRRFPGPGLTPAAEAVAPTPVSLLG